MLNISQSGINLLKQQQTRMHLQEISFYGKDLLTNDKTVFNNTSDLNTKTIEILKGLKPTKKFNRLRLQNPNYIPNLAGVDLGDLRLEKINFDKAILKNASFSYSKLRSATFEKADLKESDFFRADLINVNFKNADLRSAIFVESDLSGANLKGAKLADALIIDADLYGTIVSLKELRKTADETQNYIQQNYGYKFLNKNDKDTIELYKKTKENIFVNLYNKYIKKEKDFRW